MAEVWWTSAAGWTGEADAAASFTAGAADMALRTVMLGVCDECGGPLTEIWSAGRNVPVTVVYVAGPGEDLAEALEERDPGEADDGLPAGGGGVAAGGAVRSRTRSGRSARPRTSALS
jgi:hypothetical protein